MSNRRKIPSQFSIWLSPNYQITSKFINISELKKCCGRAENRTRNCWVTTNCLTTKLLAHNKNVMHMNYLNFIEDLV